MRHSCFRHSIIIVLALFSLSLCGCPMLLPGDKPLEDAMAEYFLWQYKKRGAHKVLVGTSMNETRQITVSVAEALNFEEYAHYNRAAYSLFAEKKIINSSDSVIVMCGRDHATGKLLDIIFLFHKKNNKTEIEEFSFSFHEDELIGNPNSIIYFDWTAAIKSKCDSHGIGSLIRR